MKQPAQSLEASTDGSQVWAIAQHNLLYSADSGAHWDARELPFASSGNLRLHRIDDTNLFITSNMGLYASKDAGTQLEPRRHSGSAVPGCGGLGQRPGGCRCRDVGCSRRWMPASPGST